MTVEALKYYYLQELSNIYPKEEIRSFYYILMKYRLGFSKTDTILFASTEIQKEDLQFFETALAELIGEKPIQYIIDEAEFYGLLFKVNIKVLIPRPETEELVEWVLSDVGLERLDLGQETGNKKWETRIRRQESGDKRHETGREKKEKKLKSQPRTILDIGTGSGCIAIALAKNLPNAKVYALDVSKDALSVARENAIKNNVKVYFLKANVLTDDLSELPNFDIIISNPPYVRESEKAAMPDNVLLNEPHLALFVKDNDPLVFYQKIIGLARTKLKKDGALYFEINQYLAEETEQLLAPLSSRTEIREDLRGNKRMLKIRLSSTGLKIS